MNLYLHSKWIFVECFQTAIFTTSKAQRYSAYKTKLWNSLLCISHFQAWPYKQPLEIRMFSLPGGWVFAHLSLPGGGVGVLN